jgi:hypothetical protein
MNPIILETKELVLEKFGFIVSNLEIEKESSEYCAHRFEINKLKVVFRQAKITPTKTGQFVTLWKRNSLKNVIEPFEIADDFDLVIINVKKENRLGQFVFPKSILIEKGIVSDKKEGKRGIRVYPSWDLTQNKQAQKTQKWQLDYFLEIPVNGNFDINRAKSFYKM